MKLSNPTLARLQILEGVGPIVVARLQRLGIFHVEDLVTYWPRTWLDLTDLTMLDKPFFKGQKITIRAKLEAIKYIPLVKARLARVEAVAVDEFNNKIDVVWFNQGYLSRVLKPNRVMILHGAVAWNWQKKSFYLGNPKRYEQPRILPIYSLTKGLTSSQLNKIILKALAKIHLPQMELKSFMDFNLAIKELHSPTSIESLNLAKSRIAQDEWNLLQFNLNQSKPDASSGIRSIEFKLDVIKSLVGDLPFDLTPDQKKAAWQLMQNISENRGSQALLQGEVGSGKTIVAALVLVSLLRQGYPVAWLAPTRVLATQLVERLTPVLKNNQIELVVGGVKVNPEPGVLYIGTHALLSEENEFGLVIIDEQHRFGVEQRSKLLNVVTRPHLISMTATPIPRSLAMIIVDQLKVVSLKNRPRVSNGTLTSLVEENDQVVENLILKEVKQGRQGFIVVPRIMAKEGNKSLQDVLNYYQKRLPSGFRLGVFHGQQTEQEQEQVIDKFSKKEIDILVATSIIEVGIDFPNASFIIIDSAENFGLAQLHQLRGRVGRGDFEGYCLVIGDKDSERLQQFVRLRSGFDLAEVDLKLRGPGNLVGLDQTGWPKFRFAELTNKSAQDYARVVVKRWRKNPPLEFEAWRKLLELREEDSDKILD